MCLLHYIVVKESKSFGATTECIVGGGWVITVAALLVWLQAGSLGSTSLGGPILGAPKNASEKITPLIYG